MSLSLYKALVVLWTGVILLIIFLSLVPESVASSASLPPDWSVGHVPAYLLLTLITAAVASPGRHVVAALLWGGIGASLFGLSIEIIQPMTGRHASLEDVLLNQTGVLLGVLLGWFGRRQWRIRGKSEAGQGSEAE